ncbi:MAG TPA: hypothetical protein VGV87_14700 [Blastocatellia bacterium]|jgi:hypothetical protein|nr:hypothetical protein [Blastocatellia bacterium]
MFSRTKGDANGERLDEVGADLVQAARASDDQIESAAAAPLLYSRIRASIAARQRELENPTGTWPGFLRAARLAVPVMALVTVVVTFVPRMGLNARNHEKRAAGYTDLPAAQEPGILVFAAGACALSNSEECAISNNEVLATLFADDNQEKER